MAVDDLDRVTHDPLLAALRRRLRATAAGYGAASGSLRCVYSKEPVRRAGSAAHGGLHCAGYGSTVTVTATFGLVAAGEAMRLLLARAAPA